MVESQPIWFCVRLITLSTHCSWIRVCHSSFGKSKTADVDKIYQGVEYMVYYHSFCLNGRTFFYSVDARGPSCISQELYGGWDLKSLFGRLDLCLLKKSTVTWFTIHGTTMRKRFLSHFTTAWNGNIILRKNSHKRSWFKFYKLRAWSLYTHKKRAFWLFGKWDHTSSLQQAPEKLQDLTIG